MYYLTNIIKQSRIIILLCLFCFNNTAQVNLIPNPSFEDSTGIPQSASEFYKVKNWNSLLITPDYFSVYSPATTTVSFGGSVNVPINCFGIQKPRAGNFYVGIFLRTFIPASAGYPPFVHFREAIGAQLNQQLIANHSYSFTMYYSLADGSGYTTNGLDVIFSYTSNVVNTSPSSSNDTTYYYNATGQITHDNSLITDTVNWIKLSGCFIANGTEKYILIGHFKDATKSALVPISHQNFNCNLLSNELNNACYIYIDDVSLYDMGLYLPASAKNDTLICNGTALNISNNPLKDSSVVVWSPPSALSCTNCPNPIATPTTSTLYYVNKSICGASSKDSILVRVHTPTTNPTPFSDETICLNEIKQIGYNDSTNFTSYSWFPAYALTCTNCAAPYASPDITTTYTLTRTECSTSFNNTVTVTVDDCNPTYTVPNVFTPNYDDVNDTWGIKFSNTKYIKNFQMHIYDRWGLLVYSTNPDINTPNSKWDGHTSAGTECSAGVYFYVISFDKNEEKVELKGTLNLFR